jgi:hypothetical protein
MPNGKIGLETPPVVARKGHFLRAQSRKKRRLLGSMKGKVRLLGDIFSTGEEWEAEP